jgi:hypothetical protein
MVIRNKALGYTGMIRLLFSVVLLFWWVSAFARETETDARCKKSFDDAVSAFYKFGEERWCGTNFEIRSLRRNECRYSALIVTIPEVPSGEEWAILNEDGVVSLAPGQKGLRRPCNKDWKGDNEERNEERNDEDTQRIRHPAIRDLRTPAAGA